jgi:hypothetical protein
MTLREWISGSKARGTLEPFTPALTCWRIPKRYRNGIRKQLLAARIVFYWRHYSSDVPPDWDGRILLGKQVIS